ncbi:MAG: hypothetical protein QM398_11875 [Thermoproteota archaeon]|nr:hypothetical protein [Thermoproteota archaeon]
MGDKEPTPLVITRPYKEMQSSAILENKMTFFVFYQQQPFIIVIIL